jgi:hypothetical protein
VLWLHTEGSKNHIWSHLTDVAFGALCVQSEHIPVERPGEPSSMTTGLPRASTFFLAKCSDQAGQGFGLTVLGRAPAGRKFRAQ